MTDIEGKKKTSPLPWWPPVGLVPRNTLTKQHIEPLPVNYIIIFIQTDFQAKQRHIRTRRLQQPLVIRDFNCAVPSCVVMTTRHSIFGLETLSMCRRRVSEPRRFGNVAAARARSEIPHRDCRGRAAAMSRKGLGSSSTITLLSLNDRFVFLVLSFVILYECGWHQRSSLIFY